MSNQDLKHLSGQKALAPLTSEHRFLRAHFDGGCRETFAGAGWIVEASADAQTWEFVREGYQYLGDVTSVTAELESAMLAVADVLSPRQ